MISRCLLLASALSLTCREALAQNPAIVRSI